MSNITEHHKTLAKAFLANEFCFVAHYLIELSVIEEDRNSFSEAVIVGYDLMRLHLLTFSSNGNETIDYSREMKRAMDGSFRLLEKIIELY